MRIKEQETRNGSLFKTERSRRTIPPRRRRLHIFRLGHSTTTSTPLTRFVFHHLSFALTTAREGFNNAIKISFRLAFCRGTVIISFFVLLSFEKRPLFLFFFFFFSQPRNKNPAIGGRERGRRILLCMYYVSAARVNIAKKMFFSCKNCSSAGSYPP